MRYRMVRAGLVLTLGVAIGAAAGCGKKDEGTGTATTAAVGAAEPGSVPIAVDTHGFSPASVEFKKGEKARLVFTRTSDDTCAKEVAFPEIGVKKDLPLNKPVAVDVPTDTARTLTFQCGMGMYKSKVVIR